MTQRGFKHWMIFSVILVFAFCFGLLFVPQ